MTNALTERWRAVKGYEGLYEVSDLGRVRSTPRNGTRGGILKADRVKHGYDQVRLYQNNEGKVYRVHRLVMLSFHGDSRLQVNHKNGVKHDNRLSNLEYVTPSENAIHARKLLGNWTKGGESHPTAKLCERDVNRIKSLKGEIPQRDIAREYGISETQVSRIMNGKRWNK